MTFLFFEGMSERNYISLIFITTGENGSSDYRLELFCVTTFKQRRSRCTGFKDEKKRHVIYIIQTLNKHINVFILPVFSGVTLSL